MEGKGVRVFDEATRERVIRGWNGKDPWCQELHMEGNGIHSVYYAPFDYVNEAARLTIVGITPGVTQARLALFSAQQALESGAGLNEALARAKVAASFGGPTRRNLVAMLDAIGLPALLGIRNSAALFEDQVHRVHFTSVLRYPVLTRRDMLGDAAAALSYPMLGRWMEHGLVSEVARLGDSLFLPLGRGVEIVLDHLIGRGLLRKSQVLVGLPHPSGANSERIAYFLGRKPRESLSIQTNADRIDQSRARLLAQLEALREGGFFS